MPDVVRCLKCGSAMDSFFDTSATCLACGGTWIPASALLSRLGEATGRKVEDDLARLFAMASRATSLRCPACPSAGMSAVRVRGIELESCSDCRGVFLDLGEAERLRAWRPRHASASFGAAANALDGPGGIVLDLLVQLLASVIAA